MSLHMVSVDADQPRFESKCDFHSPGESDCAACFVYGRAIDVVHLSGNMGYCSPEFSQAMNPGSYPI